MPSGSEDSRINAEATVKAACIRAATDLILAGKVTLPPPDSEKTIEYAVAHIAMEIWGHLEKPKNWPA